MKSEPQLYVLILCELYAMSNKIIQNLNSDWLNNFDSKQWQRDVLTYKFRLK